jgi:hypothetical protein
MDYAAKDITRWLAVSLSDNSELRLKSIQGAGMIE